MATAAAAAAAALNIGGQVERVDGRQLSYGDFVRRFLEPNRPVLLTGLMDAWPACTDWVAADGSPNLLFFSARFAHSVVPVANCSKRELTDQKRLEMSVSEFITYWLQLSAKKNNGVISCKDNDEPLLYLKDWHFVKDYPYYVAYKTPTFFDDDWLNTYLDSHVMHRDSDISRHENEINCADYRFVYMGPKGTWTPLHADVFRSYSWSANICGRKLWLFLSPSQRHLVFDRIEILSASTLQVIGRNFRTSVYNIYDEISETQFPGFKETTWLECTQEQNEIIFVPSGWYHQVHNLEDTISINHNWFNSYNLPWVWNLLVEDYNVAREYIEDIRDICDDFEGICQRNLAANTGMNFYDFMIFITRITLVNLIQLDHIRRIQNTKASSINKIKNAINNLKSIRIVASEMKSVDAFAEQNLNCCSAENRAAFSDIEKILGEQDFQDLYKALMRTYNSIHEQQEPYTGKTARELHLEDCLLLKWPKTDGEILSSTILSCSKIRDPEDLVGLIDHAIEMIDSTFSNCNLSLSIESNDVGGSSIQ